MWTTVVSALLLVSALNTVTTEAYVGLRLPTFTTHSISGRSTLRKAAYLDDDNDAANDRTHNIRTNRRWISTRNRTENKSHGNRHDKSRNFRRKNTRPSIEYVREATRLLLDQSWLENGRWHQAISILKAWSSLAKDYAEAPSRMHEMLDKLQDEYELMIEMVQDGSLSEPLFELEIEYYNLVLDAWCCAALFKTQDPQFASQKARELLVYMQASYDSTVATSHSESIDTIANAVVTSNTTGIVSKFPRPNQESFRLVAHVVCRIEGCWMARRLLAWREYLNRNGKHGDAMPTRLDYIRILEAYAKSGEVNAGFLAQGFLRHLKAVNHPIDTLYYNLAMKAWSKSRKSRDAAEQVEQILLNMDASPDAISYATAIGAWAASGTKLHAIERAETLLRRMEEHDGLEPNTYVINAVMSTWAKSYNPAAVDRTAELLQHLEQPDSYSYNTHLHTLSMHSARDSTYAVRASVILQRWMEEYRHGKVRYGPTTFSYNNVIEAYCKSTSSDAVQNCADTLRQLVKNEGVEPDTFSFNQVLAALSRNSNTSTVQKARDLLQYQIKSFRSGVHTRAPPDAAGFSTVITAYSRSGTRGAAEQAEDLFEEMKVLYNGGLTTVKPNVYCYNALIDCWAKSGEGTLGARKAEALVEEMRLAYQAGDESMQPNLVTYNALLNAWARSGTRCCGRKAETYLNTMWAMYNAGDKRVKPNDFSYNTVINAISKSKNAEKAQKALRLLRRMDKLYQAGNKEARPDTLTYTAVLNSCAFPATLDFRTRRKALDTAIFTLQELQGSRYGQPNQITYGTFIRACAALLYDDDTERRQVLEQVFKQCCKDGQVGKMVLTYLRKAAPPGLYEDLLADFICSTGETISIEDLPPSWRCNTRTPSIIKTISSE